MPLYEYACQSCEHTFETLVYNGDKVECPECESDKLQRLLSLPGMPVIQGDSGGGCGEPGMGPCGAQGCRRR